ncbi:hypothetical protein OS493_006207 [Desmophyllum pertusum]|uniref:Dynamin stalk domain-containing protein n=1 Tax=Desmophyllum pertusum TaxID=174260 RepID=A0A9X0DC16_9CNID|nr:hypothetical protein OS493_006207 [Desmophyllum pertusum]
MLGKTRPLFECLWCVGGPFGLRDDDEIRKQQKKLEGVAAPLGDSSENSQLLQKLLYEDYTGYQRNGKAVIEVRVQSPVDQLFPLSQSLVENVEVTLRKIVQKSIEHSLSKFPSLKQAVEAKVVSTIFDTKRDQTIQFIRQFLAMQKKRIDVAKRTPKAITYLSGHEIWKGVRLPR